MGTSTCPKCGTEVGTGAGEPERRHVACPNESCPVWVLVWDDRTNAWEVERAGMTDRQQERAAAQLGLCPVCNRGPARMTVPHDDGSQEGVCENCEPPRFLERDSEKEPWREVELEQGA
jgi:hypothetical protein